MAVALSSVAVGGTVLLVDDDPLVQHLVAGELKTAASRWSWRRTASRR
jgi:hypothetical protein